MIERLEHESIDPEDLLILLKDMYKNLKNLQKTISQPPKQHSSMITVNIFLNMILK